MEPVGFAVGVVGLAGLFTNVVDCLNYVRIAKSFGTDFETYMIKLDCAMLKLSRWGAAIGLSGSIKDATYLPSWIKEEDAKIAEEALGQILNLFAQADQEAEKFKGKEENRAKLEEYDDEKDLKGALKTFGTAMKDKCLSRKNQVTTTKKLTFAVYSRERLEKLINETSSLTDNLVGLFPGKAKKQNELCAEEVKALTESLQELAEMIKDNDKTLRSALDKFVDGGNSEVNITISGRAQAQGFGRTVEGNKFVMNETGLPTKST